MFLSSWLSHSFLELLEENRSLKEKETGTQEKLMKLETRFLLLEEESMQKAMEIEAICIGEPNEVNCQSNEISKILNIIFHLHFNSRN